jgi:hypothetical protein
VTTRTRTILLATAAAILLVAGLGYEILSTGPVRGAVRAFSDLVTIGNRLDLPQETRMAMAQELCSSAYLSHRPLALGPEGGIVGLPRAIDKNFEAWREGPNVWICPTKRTNTLRPVYQFVRERGAWRFDGPVAILRPWGEVIRTTEIPGLDAP